MLEQNAVNRTSIGLQNAEINEGIAAKSLTALRQWSLWQVEKQVGKVKRRR